MGKDNDIRVRDLTICGEDHTISVTLWRAANDTDIQVGQTYTFSHMKVITPQGQRKLASGPHTTLTVSILAPLHIVSLLVHTWPYQFSTLQYYFPVHMYYFLNINAKCDEKLTSLANLQRPYNTYQFYH